MLYGVDATRLAGCKPLRLGGFGRIVFNFPHVGGKTRDVNRQVRYNQGSLASLRGISVRSLLSFVGMSG